MVSFNLLKFCSSLGCKVGKQKPSKVTIGPVRKPNPSFTIGTHIRNENVAQSMNGATQLAEQNKAQITIKHNVTTPSHKISETQNVTSNSSANKMTIGEVQNAYTGHRYQLYNRTPQDLKNECDVFKLATGAELHVPSTMASDLFGEACIVLERAAKDGNFPKEIKHVLVGHGYGSSVAGDWSIINGGGNIFHYINHNPNIKKGDKVLVLSCETYGTVKGRNGIGKSVILSLTDGLHPAKIVVAGENKVAGELYFPRLLQDNTKPSVHMYSDKPAFTVKQNT